MKRAIERASEWWCRIAHRKAMWPINEHYLCAVCLRKVAVEWRVLNENRPLRQVSEIGARVA